jgi:hypothetical protein
MRILFLSVSALAIAYPALAADARDEIVAANTRSDPLAEAAAFANDQPGATS